MIGSLGRGGRAVIVGPKTKSKPCFVIVCLECSVGDGAVVSVITERTDGVTVEDTLGGRAVDAKVGAKEGDTTDGGRNFFASKSKPCFVVGFLERTVGDDAVVSVITERVGRVTVEETLEGNRDFTGNRERSRCIRKGPGGLCFVVLVSEGGRAVGSVITDRASWVTVEVTLVMIGDFAGNRKRSLCFRKGPGGVRCC